MKGRLTSADGTTVDATPDEVRRRLAGTDFFWLDLDGLDDEASDLLLHGFGFHPLAVEDAEHFGQRPEMEDYPDFTYFVVYGAEETSPTTIEVHLFYSEQRVVTVHGGPCLPLDEVRSRLARPRHGDVAPPQVAILYHVVDQLVDSFFPV